MPRPRPAAPAPAPGQVWAEYTPTRGLTTAGRAGYVYNPTGRQLWIREVGKARRGFADDGPTVKADGVKSERGRRTEIYARNIRPPRWRLVMGAAIPEVVPGRKPPRKPSPQLALALEPAAP